MNCQCQDACPIRSLTFSKPCWWKAAFPETVQNLRTPGPDGKLASVDYGVANVIIRIRRIESAAGAAASELPLLQAAAEKLSGRDYYRALLTAFDEHAVLPVYHEHGYLKASCVPQQPRLVKNATPETIDDKEAVTLLDVTIAITPGAQYKVTGWDWSGNEIFRRRICSRFCTPRSVSPPTQFNWRTILRAVQQLYGSRGYVTAAVKADAAFGDAAGTVAYQLAVTEGPVYHMGELGISRHRQ